MLELSKVAKLFKLRPNVNDDHALVQQVANDLWFKQVDYEKNAEEKMVRRNLTSSEKYLMALVLRTKPDTNAWPYLSPRKCTLAEDAVEHVQAVIKGIHLYLKNLQNERDQAGAIMLQLMQNVKNMSLFKFQPAVLATRAHVTGPMQSWKEWEWDGRHPSGPPEGLQEPDCELC